MKRAGAISGTMLIIAVGGACVAALGAHPRVAAPQVVRARRFELVDAQGKTRALLSYEAGVTSLVLVSGGSDGQRGGAASIFVRRNGMCGVGLYREGTRAWAALSVEDEPALHLRAQGGKLRVIKP